MKRNMVLSLLFVLTALSNFPASAGTWSDGFEEDQLEDWELASQVGPTTSKMENGELSVEVHSEFISYLRVIDSNQWENYTLSVKVKILDIFGSYVDGGIMIRESGNLSKHYYFFIADRWLQIYPGVPPEGKGAFVFPSVNGQVKMGQAKVFTPEFDYWYTLKAVAQGTHTEFYVDNDLVGTFDYDEIKPGSVGLVVSNALVHFDDFIVTGPDIPDGGPGGVSFAVKPKDKLATTWGEVKQKW